MAINTLEEKFQFSLNSIYDAEHQFLEAQQTLLESATAPSVQASLKKHIAETEQQIVNLEKVHELLGLEATRETCAGAEGIVTEGNTLVEQTSGVPALADLAINGSCSKVEHFEIATYRGLIAGAQMMGQTEVVRLLQENLTQEENTADLLEASMPELLERAMQNASTSSSAATS
jgi:ferritin-like metal-binding protein YciE